MDGVARSTVGAGRLTGRGGQAVLTGVAVRAWWAVPTGSAGRSVPAVRTGPVGLWYGRRDRMLVRHARDSSQGVGAEKKNGPVRGGETDRPEGGVPP
ncbi:hypothetical protein GCM10010398_43700 [Streptomyces fimbriatus]